VQSKGARLAGSPTHISCAGRAGSPPMLAYAKVRALYDAFGIACIDSSAAFLDEDLDTLRIAPNEAPPNTRANGIFAAAVLDQLFEMGWLTR